MKLALACPLLAALLVGCASLVDLRTAPLRDGISEQEAARGLAILERSIGAHGGRDTWVSSAPVRYRITDTWPSPLMHAVAMPWPRSPQQMEILVDTGKDNARLTFLDGPAAGEARGIQN